MHDHARMHAIKPGRTERLIWNMYKPPRQKKNEINGTASSWLKSQDYL